MSIIHRVSNFDHSAPAVRAAGYPVDSHPGMRVYIYDNEQSAYVGAATIRSVSGPERQSKKSPETVSAELADFKSFAKPVPEEIFDRICERLLTINKAAFEEDGNYYGDFESAFSKYFGRPEIVPLESDNCELYVLKTLDTLSPARAAQRLVAGDLKKTEVEFLLEFADFRLQKFNDSLFAVINKDGGREFVLSYHRQSPFHRVMWKRSRRRPEQFTHGVDWELSQGYEPSAPTACGGKSLDSFIPLLFFYDLRICVDYYYAYGEDNFDYIWFENATTGERIFNCCVLEFDFDDLHRDGGHLDRWSRKHAQMDYEVLGGTKKAEVQHQRRLMFLKYGVFGGMDICPSERRKIYQPEKDKRRKKPEPFLRLTAESLLEDEMLRDLFAPVIRSFVTDPKHIEILQQAL